MNTMIEKVARALTETQIRSANELFKLSDPRRVRTEDQIIASIDASWRMNEKDARAAIGAMSEPDDSMKLAGGLKLEAIMFEGDPDGTGMIFTDVGHVYRAMVQASLKEAR